MSSAWQHASDRWTEYSVAMKAVTIRRPDQLPGIVSINPEDLVGQKFGQTFEQLLSTSEVLHVGTLPDSEYGKGTISLTMKPDNGPLRLRVLFGANSRYLPVYSAMLNMDDHLLEEKHFEYQTAAPRDALILKNTRTSCRPEISALPEALRNIVFSGEIVVSVSRYQLLDGNEIVQRQLIPEYSWDMRDVTKWESELAAAELRRAIQQFKDNP